MNATYDDSSRFLGMLAEVAVKTLNAEQERHKTTNDQDKMANRKLLSMEQMKKLSGKGLVESFSELIRNSNDRSFRLRCILMPNQCDVVFHSRGTEDEARTLMEDHLLNHIRDLESNFVVNTLNSIDKNKLCVKSEVYDDSNVDQKYGDQCSNKKSYKESKAAKRETNDLVEDHCYTSLDGPKVKAKPLEKCDKNLLNTKKRNVDATEVIATPAFPFIYEPVLPNISQVIEIGPTVHHKIDDMQRTFDKTTFNQTIDETLVDELSANALQLKRLALQYINDIRVKNRGQSDKNSFRCKICIDKTFTSPTTLIYHYRSHAGVKPYECTLCKATFTRQHSLNYHTLIHLNKSRFVCDECGRNFRHPSHFKEHMRRHTGETPYECTDCFIKFKTRNTYKRHLQTKHAKMLTSKGIFDLPDSSLHLRKPCPPRRKYGLGFLHQNIEAVARYERAQQEVSQHSPIRTNCHRINSIDSNLLINSCNKNISSGKNNFEKLLQAVAIAEDNQRSFIP